MERDFLHRALLVLACAAALILGCGGGAQDVDLGGGIRMTEDGRILVDAPARP